MNLFTLSLHFQHWKERSWRKFFSIELLFCIQLLFCWNENKCKLIHLSIKWNISLLTIWLLRTNNVFNACWIYFVTINLFSCNKYVLEFAMCNKYVPFFSASSHKVNLLLSYYKVNQTSDFMLQLNKFCVCSYTKYYIRCKILNLKSWFRFWNRNRIILNNKFCSKIKKNTHIQYY